MQQRNPAQCQEAQDSEHATAVQSWADAALDAVEAILPGEPDTPLTVRPPPLPLAQRSKAPPPVWLHRSRGESLAVAEVQSWSDTEVGELVSRLAPTERATFLPPPLPVRPRVEVEVADEDEGEVERALSWVLGEPPGLRLNDAP